MGEAPSVGAAPTLVSASLKGLCPQCGARTLYTGLARFASRCRNCGLDFASFNVGDGPALFLILIVGTVLTVAALMVDIAYSPRWYVHLVWAPLGIAMTLAGLRIGKAALLFQENRHRAREGRVRP